MKQSMHFPNQLYERVEMTWEELLNKCKGRYQEVLPNESTTHIIVRKKTTEISTSAFSYIRRRESICWI